jgi:hypothetical protein
VNREETTSSEEDPLLEYQFDPEPESASVLTPQELIEKYDGSRMTGVRKPSYERLTDREVCPTDPDASPMQPSGGGSSVLGYSDHYIVDGGKQRIILHTLVTPASIMDNTPLLDLVRWVCTRWQLKPKQATGDTKYGTIPNIVGLEKMDIRMLLLRPILRTRMNADGGKERRSADIFLFNRNSLKTGLIYHAMVWLVPRDCSSSDPSAALGARPRPMRRRAVCIRRRWPATCNSPGLR